MPAPDKLGILLVNLGTPDAPETAAVRRYLAEFLSDPRVIDIHPVARWLLLHLIILRVRPAKSAHAYRAIWGPEGSPLLVHGRALTAALAERLPAHPVVLAMRYGAPSIDAGLRELEAAGCDRILVAPLFPHYASSSTGSALEAVYRAAGERLTTPFLHVLPPFYDHPAFIDALAHQGAPLLAELQPDHVVYSFHGLPERHLTNGDQSGAHCLKREAYCAAITALNRSCYRAQCYATARELVEQARDGVVVDVAHAGEAGLVDLEMLTGGEAARGRGVLVEERVDRLGDLRVEIRDEEDVVDRDGARVRDRVGQREVARVAREHGRERDREAGRHGFAREACAVRRAGMTEDRFELEDFGVGPDREALAVQRAARSVRAEIREGDRRRR